MADLLDDAAARRTFHTLDGLRGIAAIFVVCRHFKVYLKPFWAGSAYLAVDLFFLMSGFVLANAYGRRLGVSLKGWRFVVIRFVRLYPLYLLGTLIGIGVPALGLVLHLARIWTWGKLLPVAGTSLLMLPSPIVERGEQPLYLLNVPAWSLLFEMIANAAYGATRMLRGRWTLVALIAVGAVAVTASTIGQGSANAGWTFGTWWCGASRVAFSFFLGVCLYNLYARGHLPKVAVPIWIVLAGVAMLLYFTPPTAWRVSYDLAAILVVFPVVVWLCVVNEPRRGIQVLTTLGLVSYPLYAVHQPSEVLVDRFIDRLLGGDAAHLAPWLGLAELATLLVVSWVLARTFDPWARQWLGRAVGLRVPRVA